MVSKITKITFLKLKNCKMLLPPYKFNKMVLSALKYKDFVAFVHINSKSNTEILRGTL